MRFGSPKKAQKHPLTASASNGEGVGGSRPRMPEQSPTVPIPLPSGTSADPCSTEVSTQRTGGKSPLDELIAWEESVGLNPEGLKCRLIKVGNLGERMGRCYELSFRGAKKALRAGEHWDLVHGEIDQLVWSKSERVKTKRIGHAWLERDGHVYDATKDLLYPMEAFYSRYKAAILARYAGKEAEYWGTISGHCGPWLDDPDTQALHVTLHPDQV